MPNSFPRIVLAFVVTLGLVLLGGSAASALTASSSGPGIDVSWPQCGKTPAKHPAFAIVGVNYGLANTTNPCLASQLAWAKTAESLAGTAQPKVALYVNTANPGRQGSWWPTSNIYDGVKVTNPYGNCALGSFKACSYMYGWAKASDDAKRRGVRNPQSYLWWLDVETENTWQADKAANVAVLEGMTASFKKIGARVGLYSNAYQWGGGRRSREVHQPAGRIADLARWSAIGGRRQGELCPPRAHRARPCLDDAIHLRWPRLQPLVQLIPLNR